MIEDQRSPNSSGPITLDTPVGSDHVIPPRWVTEIHRDWNARYVWPKFVTAVPADFFEALPDEAID